jgi:hypothetical protein
MTLYEIYQETNYRPIMLVHCTRCGGEYCPTEMILLDMGNWVCPLESCHGMWGVSIFPVVTTEE